MYVYIYYIYVFINSRNYCNINLSVYPKVSKHFNEILSICVFPIQLPVGAPVSIKVRGDTPCQSGESNVTNNTRVLSWYCSLSHYSTCIILLYSQYTT